MQTIHEAWAGPMVELAKAINVDINAPLRTYVAEGFSQQPGELLRPDEIDMQGLVSLQWEWRDELWLDGKLLWVAGMGWQWDEVVLSNGKHYQFDETGAGLVPCDNPVLQLASERHRNNWLLT